MKQVTYCILLALLLVTFVPHCSFAQPSPVTIVSPKDSATALINPITFIWNKSPLALAYTLQVSTSNLFSSPVVNQSITDTFYTTSLLLSSTLYYWRVNATNDGGTSDFSSTYRFSTGTNRLMVIYKIGGAKNYVLLSTIDSLIFQEPAVPVNSGTFTAGTTLTTISGFKIGKYEVTFELWTAVRTWALTHGYTDMVAGQNGYSPVGTNNPVTQVNWHDIVKWCNARSEKDGLTPVYYTDAAKTTVYRTGEININSDAVNWTAMGYRLPTEAEREFAAKGGTLAQSTPYIYSGSNTIGDAAWYSINSGNATHPVGTKTANELGIYDMSGNVWEWCWDWYSETYPSGSIDPKGPSIPFGDRSIRGGSWASNEGSCQVGYRSRYGPTVRSGGGGFRCVQK